MSSQVKSSEGAEWPHGAVGEHRSTVFSAHQHTPRTPISYPLFNRHSAVYSSTPRSLPKTIKSKPSQNSYTSSQIGQAMRENAMANTEEKENKGPVGTHTRSRKTYGEHRRRLRIEDFTEAFKRKQMELFVDVKLGNGNYSKVYKAHDLKMNRMLAVKAIDLHDLSEDVRKKFLPREISCWKKLRFKYIVAMHAQYESGNMIFLTMEYGIHGNLLHFVQKYGALEERLAGRYMSQLLKALTYMHSKSIAHRDIKLENIIMFDDCIKLSDFGFVRQVDPDTLSSTFCGSKSYSPPELLCGQKYNPLLSDVWSAGVVGFVMVTDRMPFNETLNNNIIVEHQRKRSYRFPSKLNLSSECIFSIETMLTFEASKRPTSEQCLNLPWIYPHITST